MPEPESDDTELEDVAPARLLAFYDRLRSRLTKGLESGRFPNRLTDVVLLAPDLFILLVRLFLDREVPRASRQLVGGALLYFLVPTDLLPEAFLGIGGFADDVVLAAAVVSHVFSSEMRPFADRHWSGTMDLENALERVATSAQSVLGHDLHGRLMRLLTRRGVPSS
jgi:uncharacterized membrane protein YkvA (DUF1232 family)